MIFVNLQGYEPNKEWLNRANKLTADLIAARNTAERKLIIDNNAALWLELKEAFCAIHRRKCWYSESKNDYSHCHIDHFRPKSNAIDEMGKDQGGYWWLTFNWRNYRYSAPAGNIRKRDYFHVLANKANGPTDSLEDEDILFLDPTDPSDPDKLKFDNEGKVISKSSDITSRNSRQAEYTIKRLNLNHEGLVEGRRDIYRRTALLINEIEELSTSQLAKHSMARHQVIKAKLLELISMAGKFSEYSAAVKCCLRESGHDWAISIAISA